MAILAKPKEVQSNLGDFGFQSSKFQVAVNSKTFKILIDKLYTNKIQSIIRELSTNAHDSHIQAGCPERPFLVNLPTTLDPTFLIRDFGVSLTHHEVMNMYVTIFESTKEDTNEQVGAFGLGSKSPFSYTDSFSVRAFRDGEVRSYVVGYDSAGVPNITHLSTEPSEEETGFEVSFPAEYKDYATFRNEAYAVLRHFPTPPIINEISLVKRPAVIENGDWKVYANSELGTGSRFNVRQGCVVYPVNNVVSATCLSYGYSLVIDVPIGSVDVAASREALSLNEPTIEFLKKEFQKTHIEIRRYCNQQISDCPTVLEATRLFARYNSAVNDLGKEYSRPGMKKPIDLSSGTIRWHQDDKRMPSVQHYAPHGGYTSGGWLYISVNDIPKIRVVVDRGHKMIRRTLRLKAFANSVNKNYVWILHNPTNKQLSNLVRRLGLGKHQIVGITSIPDVIPTTPSASVGGKLGVYKATFGTKFCIKSTSEPDLTQPHYWLPIDKPNGGYKMPGIEDLDLTLDEFPVIIQPLARLIEIPMNRPIWLLTKNAVKRNKPDEATRFDVVLNKHLDLFKPRMKKVMTARHLRSNLNDNVASILFPNLVTECNDLIWAYDKGIQAAFTNELYHLEDAEAQAETIKAKYPLLVDNPSIEAIKEYIEFINSKESN